MTGQHCQAVNQSVSAPVGRERVFRISKTTPFLLSETLRAFVIFILRPFAARRLSSMTLPALPACPAEFGLVGSTLARHRSWCWSDRSSLGAAIRPSFPEKRYGRSGISGLSAFLFSVGICAHASPANKIKPATKGAVRIVVSSIVMRTPERQSRDWLMVPGSPRRRRFSTPQRIYLKAELQVGLKIDVMPLAWSPSPIRSWRDIRGCHFC